MQGYTIFIKNMVCRRCILTVSNLFKEHGITPLNVELGIVSLSQPLSIEKRQVIQAQLEDYGFELIDDKRMRIAEQIRIGVIEFIRYRDCQEKMNLSEFLQEKCHREYSSLSKLFTEIRGISIEKYYIAQKIELAKELLIYDELSVSEIANRLHYSSVAHLCAQFKSLTNVSPTQFRRMGRHKLKPLDEI